MTNQQSQQQQFLAEIADQIFPISKTSETQKVCFQLRFSPDNWQEENVEIARKMDTKLGAFNEQSINATLAEVLKKLKKQFREEMAKHGVNWEHKRGRPGDEKQSPWRIAYGWLWEHKFPYWQMDWLWQDLIKKAASPSHWLRFTPDPTLRGLVVPPGNRDEPPVIGCNIPYYIHVELDCDQQHVLLLNRGLEDSNYVVCPSQAFAPLNRLQDKKILMPQLGATYYNEKIRFNSTGQEEFLAIVLDDSLDLPWLTPNQKEAAPKLNPKRLKELWTRLAEDSNNWQAFYRSFQVVEASA
ncbi:MULTISPECIES: hypothetical protein [unclassified Moorena]|uniref:hypothetical protein n=1 Tax=unclassified Moorena TaxID=2683338 RepID=UPI0013C78EAE|nr:MULTISPECIES: hypothetical protein [unclassified Moorena]NEO21591.1 hypothetical protein [Moorena sp. SIO4A5]NEQ61844.1 hypothetical protein [Moorena sp. SIO4A1]